MTRSSPAPTRPIALVVGLAAVFVSLVSGGRAGQFGYFGAAIVLAVVAVVTWKQFDRPSHWAGASALTGLVSAAIFAATELSDISADGGGGPIIIPVAWLFATAGWYTHGHRVKTLRWVLTLVQVSFTSLSALVFLVAAGRSSDDVRAVGYGCAGLVGAAAAIMAVVGIVGRIRVELAKRTG